jgi:hypothetical protein
MNLKRAFGNSLSLRCIAYSNRMNSVADRKNLLKQVDSIANNVFLTRFSSQAANSFADIELPNALLKDYLLSTA